MGESQDKPPRESSVPDGGNGALARPAADTEPSASTWLGRVIDDRYRITALLGEGGMGAVFVAEHLSLHKEVALKVVRAELAGNGEVATRFAREAMATAQFEHPHVASAIDYGTVPEGGAYFVMQLVRGKSLRALLRQKQRLPWRKACELLAQVADALSAARSAEIIHRDLKPENILVEPREDGSELVKVLDFGIAHVAPRDGAAPAGAAAHQALTRVGTVMGTPGYMSPEQSVGDRVDHRSDLYALGVVLWECIAGEELWDGPDLTAIVTRQMSEPVPRLRDRIDDPSLPAELDRLVQRLTARKLDERPEHAGEVRDQLRRIALSDRQLPTASQLLSPALARARDLRRRVLSLPPRQRYAVVGGAAAGGLFMLAGLIAALGDAKPQGSEGSGAVLDKVVVAATAVVQPAVEVVASGPRIPDELEDEVDVLLESRKLRERRRAAKALLEHDKPDAIEPYLLVIAEFETARGCGARRAAIEKMSEDPRTEYLEPLRRLYRSRKTGCGFLSLQDCYACVRRDVKSSLDTIEEATGERE